jgi:hypothetical protein
VTGQGFRYRCPLCDEQEPPWRLYPALGWPICDACDAALLDDDEVHEAACRVFGLTPGLLAGIVEHQRPLVLTAIEVERRFT